MQSRMRVGGGNAHPALTEAVFTSIKKILGCDAVWMPTENKQFSDGETRVKIMENVRGCHVYVIQPTSAPANDNFMELCIMLDALKRASAEHITAVIPYMGYARQDKKVKPREPMTSKMCADFLQQAGASRVVTIDVHSQQHQAFYDIPVDNLYGGPILGEYVYKNYYGAKFNADLAEKLCVVSPDVSGAGRATALSKYLGCDTVIVDKNRPEPGIVGSMTVIGDVEGKECVIIDDMMDTGGTLVGATQNLLDKGASKISVVATHPVLSGEGARRLADSEIERIVCLDTIPINQAKLDILGDKLVQLPCAELLAKAITRHFTGQSVSSLFDNWGK